MAIDPDELRNFMLTVDVSSAAAQDDKADECKFFLELREQRLIDPGLGG